MKKSVKSKLKKVLSIDPGFTCPGFAIVGPKGVEKTWCKKFPINKFKGESDRIGALYSEIVWALDLYSPKYIIVERPAVGGGGHNAALAAGMWMGAVYLAARACKMTDNDILLIAPVVWKKFMTDNGHASKVEVSVRLLKEFKVEVKTDAEGDAASMGLLGYAALNNILTGIPYRDKIIQSVIDGRTFTLQGKSKPRASK